MILGIGIDAIEIDRFAAWHTKSMNQLKRMFSEKEITYCLQNPAKSAERFAVRFATREAFWKAFEAIAPQHGVPFLTFSKHIEVQQNEHGVPHLYIDWDFFQSQIKTKLPLPIRSFISLTHARELAMAYIILEH